MAPVGPVLRIRCPRSRPAWVQALLPVPLATSAHQPLPSAVRRTSSPRPAPQRPCPFAPSTARRDSNVGTLTPAAPWRRAPRRNQSRRMVPGRGLQAVELPLAPVVPARPPGAMAGAP
eukprot:16452368-Heterocapsa_arctica.AAC.1